MVVQMTLKALSIPWITYNGCSSHMTRDKK